MLDLLDEDHYRTEARRPWSRAWGYALAYIVGGCTIVFLALPMLRLEFAACRVQDLWR